jgi:hypothetical protein
MTLASDNKRLKRETAAQYRWRPIIVEIGAHTIRVRLKGKRMFYDVDIESIFSLGAKKEAERIRAEKKQKRKSRRYA